MFMIIIAQVMYINYLKSDNMQILRFILIYLLSLLLNIAYKSYN